MAIPAKVKKEIWDHFRSYAIIQLATVDGDKPRVRPVTLLYLDSRFLVFTTTGDAKVKQLRKNSKIEFCLPFKRGTKTGYIRAFGVAKFIMDQETREKMARRCRFFKDSWKGVDDPNFTLLELVVKEIEYQRPGEYSVYEYKI
ncbi:MAG: pyridoxamine 5'-phosphate oxidase family protein [Methanobacteriota archaeon]